RAIGPAVEARSTYGPRDTGRAPAWWSWSTSWGLIPPSGPIRIHTRAAQAPSCCPVMLSSASSWAIRTSSPSATAARTVAANAAGLFGRREYRLLPFRHALGDLGSAPADHAPVRLPGQHHIGAHLGAGLDGLFVTTTLGQCLHQHQLRSGRVLVAGRGDLEAHL